GIEGNFRSQRVGAGRVGSHGIEIADGVNQHVGRQLRRLIDIDENAASARARRTEVVRWILVFARLGSAWVIKDGDRSSAMRIVDVTTGSENDRALSRAGVVGTQSEITGASVRQLAARHEVVVGTQRQRVVVGGPVVVGPPADVGVEEDVTRMRSCGCVESTTLFEAN